MYDINWARRVYELFEKDCPRTININNCIIQRARERHGIILNQREFKITMVGYLQRPGRQVLWRKYKRLVKQSPLKTDILDSFTDEFLVCKGLYLAEQQQLTLF